MTSVTRPPLSDDAKDFLLNELLPLLHGTRFVRNKEREHAGPLGGVSNVFGYGLRRYMPYGAYANNKHHPELYQKLVEYGNRFVPLAFTAITLNHNYQTKEHVDKYNRGASYTISFGDFTGGELIIDGEQYQTNLAPVVFHAAEHPHFNLPIVGDRYSLIYFVSGQRHASDAEILHIQQSLLAVPAEVPYVVAIPTYNRSGQVVKKTLETLKEGRVPASSIYLFVANEEQRAVYAAAVGTGYYIVVGELGITNQRNFIRNYFAEGTYVISVDDDIRQFCQLVGSKLVKMQNVHEFFVNAYHELLQHDLFLWGIYPNTNSLWMKDGKITTSLKFIIGCCHGYIVRHLDCLQLNPLAESKEDYEQSILYFQHDGGVVRFGNVCVKTTSHAEGGLGKDREARNNVAVAYLKEKYPGIVREKDTRQDGFKEVRLV
jgi:hypothetical protein